MDDRERARTSNASGLGDNVESLADQFFPLREDIIFERKGLTQPGKEKSVTEFIRNVNCEMQGGQDVNQAEDRELIVHLKKGGNNVTFFDKAQNLAITGGSFVLHNITGNTRREVFKDLYSRVAVSAFHNSAQRIDPPRCHPETRVEILRFMYDWITSSPSARKDWILWMNGALGAGKTAIMQSLAEQCMRTGIAIASFFFLRSDPKRNTIVPFISTVVYQLVQAIPETLDDVLDVIEHHPLIFEEALESQIHKLIITPLLKLSLELRRLFVIFIDGLDECTDHAHQENLIEVIGKISRGTNLPLIFLVASRREPQIEAAFVRSPVSDLLYTYALDNSDIQRTSSDIRHYLNAKFDAVKSNHLHKRLLSEDWPPASAIEEIVEMSSGQFIYASVVIGCVSSPRVHPARQLAMVRDITLRTASNWNPFAYLDALYKYIFSQVVFELGKVLDILAYSLLTGTTHVRDIENVFDLSRGELGILFADLTAVILCEPYAKGTIAPQLKFLHASLRDFLLDETRSQDYYINLNAYRTNLLCDFMQTSAIDRARGPILEESIQSQGSSSMTYSCYGEMPSYEDVPVGIWGIVAIKLLLDDTHAFEVQRLRQAMMKFKFWVTTREAKTLLSTGCIVDILGSLKVLSHRFGDHGWAYSHVVNLVATSYAEHWESLDTEAKTRLMGDCPELWRRVNIVIICKDITKKAPTGSERSLRLHKAQKVKLFKCKNDPRFGSREHNI